MALYDETHFLVMQSTLKRSLSCLFDYEDPTFYVPEFATHASSPGHNYEFQVMVSSNLA